MIKRLILSNLVLVDSCEIHFGPSFNVVTGETGAGKTALIEAISLALGSRADSSLIRKGREKAFIEICFDIDLLSNVKSILEESGLCPEPGDDLVIRREISKEGKNRAFVGCRMAPLPLLQKIGAELIDMIGQHAHQALRASDSQRALLDLFGSLEAERKDFQTTWTQELLHKKRLDELEQLSLRQVRDEDIWRYQLDEIQTASLNQGEEEAVFEKHQKLSSAQELMEKIDMIIKGLSETPASILTQVSKFIKTCDSMIPLDKTLANASALLHESHIALNETLRFLQSYSQNIDGDKGGLQYLEDRLSAISRLKRKYGQNFEEIEAYRQKIEGELSRLENLSEEIIATGLSLKNAKAETNRLATQLTLKRKNAAENLQKTLTSQLQDLNMNGAEVTIEILPQNRSNTGDDAVQFWLRANIGEQKGQVKEHSSGGELSRLLFAIKIALAEKNNTPTLIFDEIDANVGGRTATIIGEKLKELGKFRQVICITHFSQVASLSDEHFGVQKLESEGRTLTKIKQLSDLEREEELLRMVGGLSTQKNYRNSHQ